MDWDQLDSIIRTLPLELLRAAVADNRIDVPNKKALATAGSLGAIMSQTTRGLIPLPVLEQHRRESESLGPLLCVKPILQLIIHILKSLIIR